MIAVNANVREPLELVADVCVALLDLHPVFERGLTAVLGEAGYAVHPVGGTGSWDDDCWSSAVPRPHLVVTTDNEDSLQQLQAMRGRNPDLLSVVLLREGSVSAFARALVTCTGAVPVDAELTEVVDVIAAAARGCTVLPSAVARHLATRTHLEEAAPSLSAQQLGWLRELAHSVTVAALARSTGYSEREMYRLLSALYARLGVATRTEALLRAAQLGLLDGENGGSGGVPLVGLGGAAGAR